MARNSSILITGASGEMGQGLIDRLASSGNPTIVTVDLNPLPKPINGKVRREYIGSILDRELLDQIVSECEIDHIFHLAALLSTRSEFSPVLAHKVNVEGTLNMLEFAQQQGESHGRPVVFFYPSSIAAYGLPDLNTKENESRISEDVYNFPTTMYGTNKLYCEHLGRYYDRHYKQLAAGASSGWVDFRSIRFPGLISALTIPSGGTSDFAPEMIHAAAQAKPYDCFVRPDTRIPFMAMPDAVDAIMRLTESPRPSLSRQVYNITAFAPSATEIEATVRQTYPDAKIAWVLDAKRQAILDTWPADIDDRAARNDWGHAPKYDFVSAFGDYLIPIISERYKLDLLQR